MSDSEAALSTREASPRIKVVRLSPELTLQVPSSSLATDVVTLELTLQVHSEGA